MTQPKVTSRLKGSVIFFHKAKPPPKQNHPQIKTTSVSTMSNPISEIPQHIENIHVYTAYVLIEAQCLSTACLGKFLIFIRLLV